MNPYEFSIQKVEEVGAMLLDAREQSFSVAVKGGNPRDIMTSTDKEANNMLVHAIKKEFPTHRLYSEEGDDVVAGSDEQWVLDPIDGSSNFSRGIPHFSVCLGLLKGGIPVVGAVYNPVTKELFSFKKGGGAFLNGSRISISKTETLAQAQVIFSPGGRKPELFDWATASFRKLLEKSLKRGIYGSSALDICFLAAGRADAVVYGTLSTLDIAGALGILYEAGGVATDALGKPLMLTEESQKAYLANTQHILTEIRALLES